MCVTYVLLGLFFLRKSYAPSNLRSLFARRLYIINIASFILPFHVSATGIGFTSIAQYALFVDRDIDNEQITEFPDRYIDIPQFV